MRWFRRGTRRTQLRDDRGVTTVEYGIILAGVAVIAIPSVILIQNSLDSTYDTTTEAEPGVCVGAGCDAITELPSAPISNTDPYGNPSAPAPLIAVAGDGYVQLSWSVPLSDGGSSLTGYTVTSSPASTGCSTTPPTTSCTVSSLTNGTPYTFSVVATNADGYTGPAATATATPTNIAAPSAPTSFVATPGAGQVALTWGAPSTLNGSTLTGYTLTVTGSGAPAPSTYGTGTTSATITPLTVGVTYTFSLVANSSAGDSPAATQTATPFGPPSAPTSFVATPGDGQVALTWGAPSTLNGSTLTGYTLTVTGSGAPGPSTYGTGTTSATITPLTNGESYTFSLVANSSAGDSPAATQSAQPAGAPSAPSPSAAAGKRSATVNWSAPANGGSPIDYYQVRYTTSGGCAGAFSSYSTQTSPFTVTGLTAGNSVCFQVTAHNAVGFSAAGTSSAVTVLAGSAPGAPTGLSTSQPANRQITVAWVAPTDMGGYNFVRYDVQRATSTSSACGATWGSAATSTTLSHTYTGLTNNGWYCFRVRTVSDNPTSSTSGWATVGPVKES